MDAQLLPSVAGVGASAGGLEAMLAMFARMQRTGRLAYVVAQHMMHDGHSELLARLIGRESALPAELGSSGARLEADTVYLIPAGKDGHVRDGRLELSEPAPENISTPSVNTLFRSIAESQRAQAIGIVLSGAGSDGTIGCRAIKQFGGLTLAQDPAEALFDGMPSAAITARLIDRILPVGCIGETLANLFPGQPKPREAASPIVPFPRQESAEPQYRELAGLLRQVLDGTGIDFSHYKEETLLRRLEKRRSTVGAGSAEEYQALIGRDPGELNVLQRLFLVSVSTLFRDRESFRALERSLSDLVRRKPEGEPIRVWVPGCASGEECYSLAVVLQEILREFPHRHPVCITGSDLNPDALATAANGIYRTAAFQEMEPELRNRYFTEAGPNFSAKPELRDCVVFERRNVLAGAPFAGLDLISCRNLLIYLKSPLQDRLVQIFHEALHTDGLLFLGQSESLSFAGNSLFATVDYRQRVFRSRQRRKGR